MKAHFAEAESIQTRETIVHWLSYQAQGKAGSETVKTPSGEEVATTILNNVVKHGDYQGGRSERAENFAGVLLVDAYVDPGDGQRWTVFANQGHLAGLSRAMLTPLETLGLDQLKLPVVYRISSLYHRDGLGDPSTPVDAIQSPGAYAFHLGVNEVGKTWASPRYKWQRAAVEKIGGEQKIYNQLSFYTLKTLKVQPDR